MPPLDWFDADAQKRAEEIYESLYERVSKEKSSKQNTVSNEKQK